MIIVTGGAGFIGSNLVRALNAQGETGIVVVDHLKDGAKFVNLADCEVADYFDKKDFLEQIEYGVAMPDRIRAIFHMGACSSTTEWDGRYMMRNNFSYSKALLHYCQDRGIPFIYASSAAVYGAGQDFREHRELERPLNVYGYSKFLFDQYVRQRLGGTSQIAGMRFFNVYGPRERHKGGMASVAWHFHQQIQAHGELRLFQGSDGYADGEQRRDFVYVGDVVKVMLWFLQQPQRSGIFNLGTGRSQTFNDVARAVIDWNGRGEIHYIPFPDTLKGRYQSYTQADITALRDAGYTGEFLSVEAGVKRYLDSLQQD